MSEQSTNTPAGTEAQPAPPSTPQATTTPATANDGARDAADTPLGESGIRALQEERAARQALERELKPLRDTVGRLQGIFGSEQPVEGEDIVQSLQQRVQQMERDTLVNTVARRHGITDEDDVAFLRTAPNEDAMGRLAGRLKAASTTTPGSPAPDPSQAAASPTPEALEEAEFAAFYPPTGK